MKSGKAVGPDDIPVEVWKCLGEAAVEFLASLFNRVLESEKMPEEWRRSVLVPIFKNKGDVQSCSNYRGIKLMSHTMKVWERVVEARLRKVVEICEQQYGFMPRKSTTDAIFALRILMEKYRDGQRELHCVFVDLEKAYDRVPREELWYCMRKSGVAEKYVRVVQDMYERNRTVVRCAVGQTEEFKVEVGLHQGSALSPFLFAMMMDQLSEEVRQESPWTMMFADDIVICSESREQVEENLERWRFALERRGMKVSRSKTEYMCVNEREGSGTVRLQGEEVKKVQEFKYLGSTVQSNGECGKEVKKAIVTLAYLVINKGACDSGFDLGKAKLASQAAQTIPRLELGPAAVAAEITEVIASALRRSDHTVRTTKMSTPDPVQDLVEVLCRALTSTSTPAPPAITSTFTAASPSPSAVTSPMAKPAPFIGSAEDYNGFLLQCSLVLEMQPHSVGPIHLQVGILHTEEIHLLVLEDSTADVILGRPWLEQHNPIISWRTGEILRWGNQCFNDCFPELPGPRLPSSEEIPVYATSLESPLEKRSTDIPACYSHFSDVFCPKEASKLPPHRPWYCAIDLIPGEPVPRGKIYSLSIPEEKAMEEYINEALSQGYIRPSTSPAASSFFFVAKKDGGLWPCIDYRALNKMTIKFRYPLPLVPSALKHLRGATVFTKLDLHSTYNLIRIREGDEWKTAFVTPTGHYEYLVMPYGLVNAPSVFQDFMHEVLREFLHKSVLVYIDDILIYSRSMADHRQHVADVLQRLRDYQLFLKAEKCTFHQPSVQFLG
ncbi:hypothetical protein QTP86_020669 [Hemibagrus guttatus]|nr:hypothetical protein QTP86_020669 [Hemibagrus guttatus]